MASPRYSWVDRTVLWSARTLLLAALSVLLTLTLAPAKVGSVWLNALTNDEVWSAIVSDIDIGATIAAPHLRALTSDSARPPPRSPILP